MSIGELRARAQDAGMHALAAQLTELSEEP
jgi:hypothetical protein